MTENEARRIINSALLIRRNNPGSAFYMDTELYHAVDMIMKQPTLPKEPTDEMLEIMRDAYGECIGMSVLSHYRAEYTALYNHLTTPPKPKTKKIKVWRVEYVMYMQPHSTHPYIKPEDAEHFVKCCGDHMTCINIIESEQEVPA